MKKIPSIVIACTAAGALIGALAGYLLIRQKPNEESIKLSADQGARVGLNIINLVKQIADLGKPQS